MKKNILIDEKLFRELQKDGRKRGLTPDEIVDVELRRKYKVYCNMEDLAESKRKKRLDTIKRMIDAYNKRKWNEKVEKLMGYDNHWKGLS